MLDDPTREAADIELSLRDNVQTIEHLLTHLPKNPFCEACIRGKMTRKHAPTRRPVDMTAIPTKFGEQVTAYHLISNREYCQGVEGSAYAVVVVDIGTRYLDCYPTADKGATEARLSLQDFIGPRQTVSSCQCDGAKELYKAAVDLGLCPSTSRPYVSQSNSIAERQIRHVEEGARTLLEQCGFALAWWPYAAR